MKTAREKAKEWLVERGIWSLKNEKNLSILLKEQDRDTRHACAENVVTMAAHDGYDESGVLIQTSKAHSVIMNTKAV